jgi:hypothetical protein
MQDQDGRARVRADRLLLDVTEAQRALGANVQLQSGKDNSAVRQIGNVVAAAAADAAYRSLNGTVSLENGDRPVAVGEMALVFEREAIAERTFTQVAEAAHLRTKLGECSVAVETVTAPSGLVSYWGFLHLANSIVVLTLDTLDPNEISMSDFRSLVTRSSEVLEEAQT